MGMTKRQLVVAYNINESFKKDVQYILSFSISTYIFGILNTWFGWLYFGVLVWGLRGRWSHVQGLKGSLPSPIIIIIIIIIIRCDWCVYHPFGNFTCYDYYSRLPLNTSSILLRLQAAGKKLCLLDMIYVFWTLKKTMKNVFSSFFQEQHISFYWFLTIFQFKFTSNN